MLNLNLATYFNAWKTAEIGPKQTKNTVTNFVEQIPS